MVFVIFGSCLWYSAAYTVEGAITYTLGTPPHLKHTPRPHEPLNTRMLKTIIRGMPSVLCPWENPSCPIEAIKPVNLFCYYGYQKGGNV